MSDPQLYADQAEIPRVATGDWNQGDRVEWNPTEDRWLPGTVVIPGERNVYIWLDEGEFLWVLSGNLRHAEDARAGRQ